MAESWRAKANRYVRGDFTNAELKIIIGGMLADQVIDIATFGALSRLKGKALQKVALPLLKRAAISSPGAVARVGGTVVGGARFIAMRHPYVAAAVVTYEVVKNREQIRQLLSEGWEVIEPGVTSILEEAAQRGPPDISIIQPPAFMDPLRERFFEAVKKRAPSKFNKAVSAGMKVIKKAKTYGGKGNIRPAKKAFTLVTKLASAKMKKRKAPKSGLRRRIWNAMKGLR